MLHSYIINIIEKNIARPDYCYITGPGFRLAVLAYPECLSVPLFEVGDMAPTVTYFASEIEVHRLHGRGYVAHSEFTDSRFSFCASLGRSALFG